MIQWFICAPSAQLRTQCNAILRSWNVQGSVSWFNSMSELRSEAARAQHARTKVLIAASDEPHEVSDINAAAALVHDGFCSEVYIVKERPSGSMRSRARRAGISGVIDPEERISAGQAHAYQPSLDQDGALGSASQKSLNTSPAAPVAGDWPVLKALYGRQAPIIVFASARGGVGKTTLAALFAAQAAAWGLHTALLDLDLSSGNLESYIRTTDKHDLLALRTARIESAEDMQATGAYVSDYLRLWGPVGKPEQMELTYPYMSQVFSALRRVSELVIVDVSTQMNDAVAQAFQVADRLLLFEDMRHIEPASMTRISSLAVRLGVARTKMVRVHTHVHPKIKHPPAEFTMQGELKGSQFMSIKELPHDVVMLMKEGSIDDALLLGGAAIDSMRKHLACMLQEFGLLPQSSEAQHFLDFKEKRTFSLFGVR